MSLANLTSPDAVISALNEFDEIGREQFLSKYGFRKARAYFLIRNGHVYDSKAVAGAAHGYEHSHLGPLKAEEFSGGHTTVKARLEALGFKVEVTEPREGAIRPLRLFEDYSRREAHDIFSPRSDFVSGSGLWGVSGIVEHKPTDFILFVTFGSEVSRLSTSSMRVSRATAWSRGNPSHRRR